MASFKDKRGVEWCLDLDVHLVELLQAEGVKIDDLLNEGFTNLRDLIGTASKLWKVLWTLCSEQAGTKGITPEQFARGLNGPALEAAGDALIAAIADFTQSRQREVLQAWLAKVKEVETEATQKAIEQIREFKLPPSTAATNSPASSESSPVVEG